MRTTEEPNLCAGCGQKPKIVPHGKNEWLVLQCRECEKMSGPSPDHDEDIRQWNDNNPTKPTTQAGASDPALQPKETSDDK